jgi:hypothetical protein
MEPAEGKTSGQERKTGASDSFYHRHSPIERTNECRDVHETNEREKKKAENRERAGVLDCVVFCVCLQTAVLDTSFNQV